MRQSVRQQSSQFDEVLLALLSLVAGPTLMWMASVWQGRAVSSSAATLESWIALLCGFVGVLLSVVWIIFLISGLLYVLALKTRNTLMLRWSRFMTPRFLRRMLLSLLGLQIAMSSQAFAAVETLAPAPASSTQVIDDAFMPSVQVPHASGDASDATADPEFTDPETADPLPTERSTRDVPELPAQPRVVSQLPSQPRPDSTDAASPDLEPTPRQVSTIDPVDQESFEVPTDAVSFSEQPYVPPAQPLAPFLTPTPGEHLADDNTIVVRRGDCLWDIAHQELGAEASVFQIDLRWRQWWEHNYQLIGDDPHTILPGTVLTAPPFTN